MVAPRRLHNVFGGHFLLPKILAGEIEAMQVVVRVMHRLTTTQLNVWRRFRPCAVGGSCGWFSRRLRSRHGIRYRSRHYVYSLPTKILIKIDFTFRRCSQANAWIPKIGVAYGIAGVSPHPCEQALLPCLSIIVQVEAGVDAQSDNCKSACGHDPVSCRDVSLGRELPASCYRRRLQIRRSKLESRLKNSPTQNDSSASQELLALAYAIKLALPTVLRVQALKVNKVFEDCS